MSVNFKPEGYHTVTPYLVVGDANKLLTFLEAAFDAKEMEKMCDGAGDILHAEVKIGDSMVMLGGKKDAPKSNVMLYLYVKDTDAVYHKAVAAGGISILAPMNQFYGDRNAAVEDAFGNQWWIATRVEDVPFEELQKRAKDHCK